MSKLNLIFEHWLATGELSIADEQALLAEPDMAQRYLTAKSAASFLSDYTETPVPQWQKETTWFAKSSPSLSFNWFSISAVGCSLVMAVLLMLNVQVSTTSEGVLISFNQHASQQQAKIDSELEQIKTLLLETQRQNQKQSWQLAQQAIDTGRLERQEDLNALVKYLNVQRQQDQQLIKLQINDLAEQVEQQGETATAKMMFGEMK
ncbi:hypothetical protein ORJ66_14570 [Pseudoalteromonas tunicata]|uniref:hypothetical protein n=1 Tax=Pseudoalteromonas tunicata TaxID=314281 RepID=UPI00273F5163|nr:hypothetical protein [Pseudoalteromonas tunicata]MDP5214276.1 hypothetical protein [Pseudoalteromonas tunicata]